VIPSVEQPAIVTSPPSWFDILDAVLQCACESLTGSEFGCPDRSFVAIGEVAWDDCCNGQLWVKANRLYRSTIFPEMNLTVSPCSGPYAMEFELGFLQCAPTSHTDGSPPTVDELETSSRAVYGAAEAIRRGISCCFVGWQETMQGAGILLDVLPGEMNFLGPDGGCVGALMSGFVHLDGCVCDAPPPLPTPNPPPGVVITWGILPAHVREGGTTTSSLSASIPLHEGDQWRITWDTATEIVNAVPGQAWTAKTPTSHTWNTVGEWTPKADLVRGDQIYAHGTYPGTVTVTIPS